MRLGSTGSYTDARRTSRHGCFASLWVFVSLADISPAFQLPEDGNIEMNQFLQSNMTAGEKKSREYQRRTPWHLRLDFHRRIICIASSITKFNKLATCMASRRHLRSTTHGDRAVLRSRTRYGQRSCAIFGPTLWNTLSPTVCDQSHTQTQLCALLKIMLFSRAHDTLP